MLLNNTQQYKQVFICNEIFPFVFQNNYIYISFLNYIIHLIMNKKLPNYCCNLYIVLAYMRGKGIILSVWWYYLLAPWGPAAPLKIISSDWQIVSRNILEDGKIFIWGLGHIRQKKAEREIPSQCLYQNANTYSYHVFHKIYIQGNWSGKKAPKILVKKFSLKKWWKKCFVKKIYLWRRRKNCEHLILRNIFFCKNVLGPDQFW